MKKIKIYPVVMAVLFVCLTVLGGIYAIGSTPYETDAQYETVDAGKAITEVHGYAVEDSVYVVEGEDPHLLMDFTKQEDGKASAVVLNLEDEVDLEHVRVYFGREATDFSEEDSMSPGKGQSDEITVESYQGYAYLRVDIDEDFSVEEMKVADDLEVSRGIPWKAMACIIVVAAVVVCLTALVPGFHGQIQKCFEKLTAMVKRIPKYRKHILYNIIGIGLVSLLALGTEIIISLLQQADANKYRVLVLFAIYGVIALVAAYRKYIISHAHILFFVILMMIGTVNIVAAPASEGVSWDDQIHYENVAFLSWRTSGQISYGDFMIVSRYASLGYGQEMYNRNTRAEWMDIANTAGEKGQPMVEMASYRTGLYDVEFVPATAPAYFPAAFGLAAGRCFDLSFVHTFMLGKWMNLLCYSIILALAVWCLPRRGKLIAALTGLIPTSIFIATAYSYDWLVVSMIVLGYSICIGAVQSGKKITTGRFLLSMAVLVVGILPKATYFPLLFPMMLMKKDKYENSKLCRALVVVGMLILLGSFVLPMLTGGAGTGDARGGTDVNATEQIGFILTQPLAYTKILLNFLAGYLSLDAASGYLTNMGYYGTGFGFTLCLLLIGVCAVLDNREVKKQTVGGLCKAGAYFAAFGCIVLAATALYVSYTPVGYETINGCQVRYILPVVFPVVYCLSELNVKVPEKLSKNIFSIGLAGMSLVFLYNIYMMCVKFY